MSDDQDTQPMRLKPGEVPIDRSLVKTIYRILVVVDRAQIRGEFTFHNDQLRNGLMLALDYCASIIPPEERQ